MRVKTVSGLILVAAIATPALGQSFLGEWTATAQTPGGEVSETLSVVETPDGYAVTANLVGAAAGAPQAGPGTDIVLDGDSFSYKRALGAGDGGGIEITYSGTVSGDTFTGSALLCFPGAQPTCAAEVPYNGVRSGDGG